MREGESFRTGVCNCFVIALFAAAQMSAVISVTAACITSLPTHRSVGWCHLGKSWMIRYYLAPSRFSSNQRTFQS